MSTGTEAQTLKDDLPPRKNTTNYGANTPAGYLNAMSKTSWWELKGKVMSSVKNVMLECLSPKHHDQWEFAAQKCFQLGFKKPKSRKPDLEGREDDSKHAELLRRVARLYVACKQDGVPREQLNSLCAVVNTTVSMDEWNELLKDVQRAMEMEKQQQLQPENEQGAGLDESSASQPSATPTAAHVLLEAQGRENDSMTGMSSGLLQQPITISEQQVLPQDQEPPQQPQNQNPEPQPAPPIRVSWRVWQLSKEEAVYSSATASRLHDRECDRRCKSYDSNKAISTAIRLVEEDQKRQGGGGKSEVVSSSKSTQDPMAVVIQNRLGYQSAQLFADKLDIMQKIIKSYREAENNDEKDFLLGLVSGSFTRDEVNRIVVPPEAQLMLPGRVRNTALISGHKWTFIRKAAGCPNMHVKLDQQKYAEGVKKRKRTLEERRLLAVASTSFSERLGGGDHAEASHHLMDMTPHSSEHDHPHAHSHPHSHVNDVNDVSHSTAI